MSGSTERLVLSSIAKFIHYTKITPPRQSYKVRLGLSVNADIIIEVHIFSPISNVIRLGVWTTSTQMPMYEESYAQWLLF